MPICVGSILNNIYTYTHTHTYIYIAFIGVSILDAML
jgi:hypothetical protein